MDPKEVEDALARSESQNGRLSDQLFNLQTLVEVAQEDLAQRDAHFAEHIGKVRELLGPIGSEDDFYEALRKAGQMRTLCHVALGQLAKGARMAAVVGRLDDYAESLAGMHTANAGLFRENLVLRQRVEHLTRDEKVDGK